MKFSLDDFSHLPEPLLDRLADFSAEVRCQAVQSLRPKYSRIPIAILRRLTCDSDTQVSQAAQKKLTSLEMHLRRQIFLFHQWLQKNPDSSAPLAGLSLSYLRYAQFWVQDETIRRYFLQKAQEGFDQLIRMYQPKLRYFYYRGLVLMALGRYRLAAANFAKILRKYPHHRGALLNLMEIFYHLHNYRFIPQLSQRINTISLPHQVAQYVNFWR